MATTASRSERLSNGRRSLPLGGLASIVASLAASALAYGRLPGSIRIRWTYGGPHYGPEVAPTALVLAGFPLFVLVVATAGWWGGRYLERAGVDDALHRIYILGVLAVLAVLVCTQVAIVVLNI